MGVKMTLEDIVGTGYRNNVGKLPVQFIPVRYWAFIMHQSLKNSGDWDWDDMAIIKCLKALGRFQEGKIGGEELLVPVPHVWFALATEVFAYGANRYDVWDWLRPQPWSAPLASAVRHAKAHILDAEEADQKSGLPHVGHLVANLIILANLHDTFKAGNDFPDKELFEMKK